MCIAPYHVCKWRSRRDVEKIVLLDKFAVTNMFDNSTSSWLLEVLVSLPCQVDYVAIVPCLKSIYLPMSESETNIILAINL